jgi:hypothetical protein
MQEDTLAEPRKSHVVDVPPASEAPWHVLSFGGGVNSMALAIHLVRSNHHIDEAIFADTGAEVPETYAYMDVARRYLEDHGIPLRVVQKPGPDLLATCKNRAVFPSAIWRWSTRDFKVRPIRKHYRTLHRPIVQYLAIAYDELERMRDSDDSSITNEYPLVDKRITREGCIRLIEDAGLPVPVKSGCWFCPFNNAERWRWLHDTHPDLYSKAVELEESSKHFPRQLLSDQMFRPKPAVPLRDLPMVPRMNLGDSAPCGADCHV